MRYPPEKIDEIRTATDIVDLIGSYTRLKKRGKNFVGLCPFHTEKTPSFNVSPERQMYHCFGCGVGGNAFTFVMELEKISFPEAVRTLAQRAGIPLPQASGPEEGGETEPLYEACSMAGRFFYRNLTETTEGQIALGYFHHRGFSDETIRLFGLGYSIHGWDSLIGHAEARGISKETLEKAGLARRRDDGTYYDYFRGRAMFPIFSPSGRVVGFGARKLREDDPLGKYINSPETPIYNKSRILYGIHHAKDALREKEAAILVEGYADLISVHQAGIHNIVASSGTALTAEQIQLIARYAKNVTIVYDADSAGSKASLRGVDLILENDLDVRVVRLPEGQDPDSFVRTNGGKAFQELLDGSVSFVDFIAGALEEQGKLKTPEGQAEAVRIVVQTIARMRDELKRTFYIKHVAEKYRLYEGLLYRELEKHLPRRGPRTTGPVQVVPVVQTELAEPPRLEGGEIPAAENDLLRAMLEGRDDILGLVFGEISPEDFTHPDAHALASVIKDAWDAEGAIDSTKLVNEIDDNRLRRLVSQLVLSRYELSKRWKESRVDVVQADPADVARHALADIRKRALTRRLEEIHRQIKEAHERGEDVSPLLEQQKRLDEEKRALSGTRIQSS